MSSKLAPYLVQIPIGQVQPDGTVLASLNFSRWLNEQLIPRTGGTVALTNLELANSLSTLAASEMVIQPAAIERAFADVLQSSAPDQFFPDVMQTFDAVGFDELTFQH